MQAQVDCLQLQCLEATLICNGRKQSHLFAGAPSYGDRESDRTRPGALYRCAIDGNSWGQQICGDRFLTGKLLITDRGLTT